jgi:hypothetical protein
VVFGSSRDNATYRVLKRYAELTGDQHKAEAVEGVFDHPMIEEVFETREKVFQRITRESGAEDAEGRWLDLSKFDHKTHSTRRREKYIRARALLSYLCSSYEVKLMARVFGEAQDEREWAKEKKSRRPKLRIWLYHYDGLTLRLSSKATPGKVIGRLQKAARTEAQKLGLLTKLTVEHEGESEAGLPSAPARPNHQKGKCSDCDSDAFDTESYGTDRWPPSEPVEVGHRAWPQRSGRSQEERSFEERPHNGWEANLPTHHNLSMHLNLTTEDIKRFRGRIDKTGKCHNWQCQLDPDGYGRFWVGGRYRRAHRVAHYLETGEEPPVVMHACDEPSCCNPSHLRGGTQQENIRDRQAKDRQAKGTQNGRSKLSDAQIKEIRRRYREEESASHRSLAREYHVHYTTIGAIVTHESYAGV